MNDSKLSFEQQEWQKCAKDPIYYLNNYGYVYNARKKVVDKLNCFDYQIECVRKFKKNRNNIILKSRQVGMSVVTAGFVAWNIIFRHDQRILIIANDGAGAIRFLSTVKLFVKHTPKWLMPEATIAENLTKIEFSNGSYAEAKASSPNAGRGDSISMLILDETAFIKDAETIWMAAGRALSVTKGKCIMISTPNGSSGIYYKTWVQAERNTDRVDDKDRFVPSKVHWRENPFCNEGLEVREDENGEQRYWSPWYEQECESLHFDAVKIAQELDLSFEGSKALVLENDLIRKYERRLETEEYQEVIKNKLYFDCHIGSENTFVDFESPFIVYKLPMEGHSYIVGGDVSRGDSTDFSTIQIIDIKELEVVAEYQGKLSPDLLAILINKAGRAYNYAYLAIEANSYGTATNLDLNRKLGYERMHFCKAVQDMYVRPYDYKILEGQVIPGFQTDKRTRPLIINNLRTHMREGALKVYSSRAINEFRNFIQKNEKPQAERGFNDDLIFALAIGLFVRDTDFENAAATVDMYKSMIDAIGYSSSSYSGKKSETQNIDEKVDEKKFENSAGIIFSESSYTKEEEDPNDISWLYK